MFLLFSYIFSLFQCTNCFENDFLIYNAQVRHYWAVDFALIKPPATLSSPSLGSPYQLSIDANYRDELYGDIIDLAEDDKEKYKEKLPEEGLGNPYERDGHLYFDFLENPSHYIKYNGKIIVIETAISGEFNIKQLKRIQPLWDDLGEKIEVTEDIITRSIHKKFQKDIFEFKEEFASDKSWAVRRFDIFTEYIIDIKNTNIDYLVIDSKLYRYLGRFCQEMYPDEPNIQNYIELRKCTPEYSTNIIIHDGTYHYNAEVMENEFDMYIVLKQIERICDNSLDILSDLENVPNRKEGDFLSMFEKRWRILRDIQAFMDISSMYIEKQKALIESDKNGDRRKIRDPYQNLCEVVEPRILEANAKALSYDLGYQTELDLYLMDNANKQLDNVENQLSETQHMLKLNKALVIIGICSIFIGIGSIIFSIFIGIGSIIFSIYSQKSQLKQFKIQVERIWRHQKSLWKRSKNGERRFRKS